VDKFEPLEAGRLSLESDIFGQRYLNMLLFAGCRGTTGSFPGHEVKQRLKWFSWKK
jgi:hypothetical protein